MAPKPRGLKKAASKKTTARPFDPSAASLTGGPSGADNSAKRSHDGTEGGQLANRDSERTMPLDEDHLSVQDLFELRQSAQAALDEEAAAAADDPASLTEKDDEARNLLRGILHGCEDLRMVLPEGAKQQQPPANDNDQGQADDSLKVQALGLHELGQTWIPYLQAWALHHMAFVVTPQLDAAQQHAALSNARGTKKRKVDLNEPTDPAQWLEQAGDRYDMALKALSHEQKTPTSILASVLVKADALRCRCDRLMVSLAKDNDNSERQLSTPVTEVSVIVSQDTFESISTDDVDLFIDSYDDPLDALVSARKTQLKAIEAMHRTDSTREKALRDLVTTLKPETDLVSDLVAGDSTTNLGRHAFGMSTAFAEAQLASFVAAEDTIEDKYRPESSEDNEDDEEDDQVEPLPVDAEDVQSARSQGLDAIKSLRAALNLVDKLPVYERSRSRRGVYERLEEAYLIYSALFNPDEADDAQRIERELAQVRSEGGLESTRLEDGKEDKEA